MGRFASTTDEDIACLVQDKDNDNTKKLLVYTSGAISNIFAGKIAMQGYHFFTTRRVSPGYHFFTTRRVSPVFEETLCQSKEKGWESIQQVNTCYS